MCVQYETIRMLARVCCSICLSMWCTFLAGEGGRVASQVSVFLKKDKWHRSSSRYQLYSQIPAGWTEISAMYREQERSGA